MPSREHALEVARRIHALVREPAIARKAAARALARLDPTDAAELLQRLLELAREAHLPAGLALSSFTAALDLEFEEIPYATELRRLADLQELAAAAALFADGPAKRQYDPGAAAKADAQVLTNTLGFMNTKARTSTNPDELSRLATASNAMVVRNLLQNPRLTEALVVRIAARRPARPEPLVEIWRSARWSNRPAVRRALAFNPYLPVVIGAKIVPLLGTCDLKELAADRGVHDALREQARELLRHPRPRKP